MRTLLIFALLVMLPSCQTLMGAAGGALGAGVGSAVAGPGGAAIGAAGGVIAAEMMAPSDTPLPVAAAGVVQPQGQIASTMHETGSLIEKIGWWYLILFVFLPLFSKKGRTWFKKFGSIHNTVSQQDIDARDEEQDVKLADLEVQNAECKKELTAALERLNRLEGIEASKQKRD